MTLTEERLDATFSALADPTRRAIIIRLSIGEATVKELAEPFTISLQAVSKHIKVLERSGLISQGVDAQRRPCRLDPAPTAASALKHLVASGRTAPEHQAKSGH